MLKHRQNGNHNSTLLDANETSIFQAINVPMNENFTISEKPSLSNTKLGEYDEEKDIFANIGRATLFCGPAQNYEAFISMNDPGYFPLR
ncbi:3935_t:CDS:2 [Ambispora leptoticha]|uniref:3935_t:CDS:1 n=1 Tax=Ambispora leptoticha TaxID=144679 RepID=A0A9N9E2S3_9GLOM|nr:3935_t:CDS:2 [Ambispora leptoticha]